MTIYRIQYNIYILPPSVDSPLLGGLVVPEEGPLVVTRGSRHVVQVIRDVIRDVWELILTSLILDVVLRGLNIRLL